MFLFSKKKFYLVKDHKISFDARTYADGKGVLCRNTLVKADIIPYVDENPTFELDCVKLKDLLFCQTTETDKTATKSLPSEFTETERTENLPLNWDLEVTLGLHCEDVRHDLQKSIVRVNDNFSCNCLKSLYKFAQAHGLVLVVKVTFKNFGYLHTTGQEYRTRSLFTTNTGIFEGSEQTYGLVYQGVYNSGWGGINAWHSNAIEYNGELDILVTIKQISNCLSNLTFFGEESNINQRILKDEIAADLCILPANGSVVKCHKNFLLAHSPVFETMFKGSFEESKTHTIEMPDMSEKAVRALLEYIYLNETRKALDNSMIAYELFHTGHKYAIKDLEDKMKSTLLSKPDEWFDVDVAVRLYLFARNIEDGEELKLRAIKLIKLNRHALKSSEAYCELFKDVPDAVMELLDYAFKT